MDIIAIFVYLFSGLCIGGALLLWLLSTVHIVHGKQGLIVETLGKPPLRARTPGLQLTAPWPFQIAVARMNLQLQQIVTHVEVKTSDNAFVKLPVTVQYHVDNTPEGTVKAHYELANPVEQITAYVLNSVRQSCPGMSFDDLFQNRDKILTEVKTALDIKFNGFGYQIDSVLVDQPQPSKEVQEAFNRVIAANQLAEAAKKEAEAIQTKLIGTAKGEAESKKLQGQGMANMRKEIATGAEEAMKTLRSAFPGCADADIMNFMRDTNWMDTLANIGNRGNLVIIDKGDAGMGSTIGATKAALKDLGTHAAPAPVKEAPAADNAKEASHKEPVAKAA